MVSRKKVFLCTDNFIRRRSYYVVAENVEQAENVAHNDSFPDYLDNDDEHLEYEDATVDEEVVTVTLVKTSTLLGKRPHKVLLVPINTKDPDAYHGYRVKGGNVDLKDRTYLKKEWQLVGSTDKNTLAFV